jgi:hypothetical protein
MPSHEEFQELGALAAIGQITAAEHAELSAHLRECTECREAYVDYSRILRQDLPCANPVRFRGKQRSLHPATDVERRERFLAHARAHGADFSPEVDSAVAPDQKPLPMLHMRWSLAAATSMAIAIGLIGSFAFREKKPISAPPAKALVVSQDNSIQQQLKSASNKLVALNYQLSALSSRNNDLTATLKERDLRLIDANRELDRIGTEREQVLTENSVLAESHERDQSLIADLKNQVQTLERSNATSVAAMVELQDKIRSLSAALEQQSDKLSMERQLATVSSDVRQLMGARNLHIIDVHDVNGTGKSAKSFGRVFYSEGESLVFYAFDLPNGRLTAANYNFQAWGQQEGQAKSVRNLGTFSVDDREQHRWVLKVNDASLLRGIDSVFVTAETVGDTNEPRGKRLLYAYLAGKPNHP